MQIITYPHPTLRHESKPIRRVDPDLRNLVREMFELMYAANGVGLAANQVDLPLRFFIINLAAKPDEGEELVMINPVISRPKGTEEAEEGCLSLPGLYGPVIRPKRVRLTAYNLKGECFDQDVEGLFSRVVQHETDHLDGVLFTDRMTETQRMNAVDALDEFETEFRSRREVGQIPADEVILERLKDWEAKYG